MDPKLRPSFTDIVKTLEEILGHLKNEEAERERKLLNLDSTERKPISVSKGRGYWGRGVSMFYIFRLKHRNRIVRVYDTIGLNCGGKGLENTVSRAQPLLKLAVNCIISVTK